MQYLSVNRKLVRLFKLSENLNVCLLWYSEKIDTATQNALTQGERIMEVLKQGQYQPMNVAEQVIVLYAATRKYLMDIPLHAIKQFEKELLECFSAKHAEIYTEIVKPSGLTKELDDKIKSAIEDFKKSFKPEND